MENLNNAKTLAGSGTNPMRDAWKKGYIRYNELNQIPDYNRPGIDGTPFNIKLDKSYFQTDIKNMLQANLKSDFEKVLDELFEAEEKVEFLMNLGYDLNKLGSPANVSTINKLDKDGSLIKSFPNIGKAFLYEMTIKFKNVLLSKQALKINLKSNNEKV